MIDLPLKLPELLSLLLLKLLGLVVLLLSKLPDLPMLLLLDSKKALAKAIRRSVGPCWCRTDT